MRAPTLQAEGPGDDRRGAVAAGAPEQRSHGVLAGYSASCVHWLLRHVVHIVYPGGFVNFSI